MGELMKAFPVYLQDKARMKKIVGDGAIPQNTDPFHGAPLVIIVSHKSPDVRACIEYTNVGCICENMQLAATDLGLGSCFLWGVLEAMRLHPELDTTSILNLPEGFMPIMGVAIGHPSEEPRLRTVKTDRLSVQYFD